MRKAGAEPEDPDLAALPPQMRAGIKRLLAGTDLDRLRGALAMMQGQAGQVPAEQAEMFEIVVGKLQTRIAELESTDN